MVQVLARGWDKGGYGLLFISDGTIWDMNLFFLNYTAVQERVLI